jgi:DNA-binding PadR family transcriptional regulator
MATEIQQHLPLTESTFYIMLCLTPEPRHGYAIMKEVEALSEGRITLSTSTLYGALKRLLEQGWIARVEEPDQNDSGRPRKAYTLTDLGRRVLEAELERLKMLVAVANERTAGALT